MIDGQKIRDAYNKWLVRRECKPRKTWTAMELQASELAAKYPEDVLRTATVMAAAHRRAGQ